MAFSQDKFTFLIICFIIPQIIIVQAQNTRPRLEAPEGNECEDERDCLRGQICDNEELQCYEERNVAFKGRCQRNAGKVLLFYLCNNKSF